MSKLISEEFRKQAVYRKVHKTHMRVVVRDCPLVKKNGRGHALADVQKDCTPCPYLVGSMLTTIKCCGHLKDEIGDLPQLDTPKKRKKWR